LRKVRNASGDGAEGDRTPDLQSATLALSQLSYGPVPGQCSFEIELVRRIHPPLSVVQRRCNPSWMVGRRSTRIRKQRS
jgi:hypothetical protein